MSGRRKPRQADLPDAEILPWIEKWKVRAPGSKVDDLWVRGGSLVDFRIFCRFLKWLDECTHYTGKQLVL